MPQYSDNGPSSDGSGVSIASRSSSRPRKAPLRFDDMPPATPPTYRRPKVPQQTAPQANRTPKPAQPKKPSTSGDQKPKRDRRELVIKWKGHEETVLRAIAGDPMIQQVLLKGRAGPFTKVQATEKLVELVADEIDFVQGLLDGGDLDQTIRGTTKTKPAMQVLRDSLKGFIERYISRFRKCREALSRTGQGIFLSITDDDSIDQTLDNPGARAEYRSIIGECPGYLVALEVFDDTSASFPQEFVGNSGATGRRAGVVGRIPGRARAASPDWTDWESQDRGTPFEVDRQGPAGGIGSSASEAAVEDKTESGSDDDDTATSDHEGRATSQATPRPRKAPSLHRSSSLGSVDSRSGTPRTGIPRAGSISARKRPPSSDSTPSGASDLRPRKARSVTADLFAEDTAYNAEEAKIAASQFQA
ncbi:hypothetical protein JCM1840_007173 [Sporobolomyces johnsonii]